MFSNKKPLFLIGAAAVALLLLRTTLAANISLGSGTVLEFGQGVQVTTSCSGSQAITLTPASSFANVSSAGAYKFNTLTVSNIPSSCYGSAFTFSAYDSATATALPLYGSSATSFTVHNWNGTYYSPGTQQGLVVTTNSSSSFTATFTTPLASTATVYRLTIQSQKSEITLTCVIAGTACTFNTRDIPRNFVSLAGSDDGSIVYAGEDGGYIYKSTNYGVTWSATPSVTTHWYSLDTSADGTKIVTADLVNGNIYTSTDSGANWTTRSSAGARNWKAVAMSSDGTKMVAVAENNYIYLSGDSGATWVSQNSAGSRSWIGVSMSSDGNKIVALVGGGVSGGIWTTTNFGTAWTQRNTPSGTPAWRYAASSADGSVVLASSAVGSLWTSNDYGATWSEAAGTSGQTWNAVDVSADGSVMVAAIGQGANGQIYSSNNSGATWNIMSGSPTKAWWSLAVSDDGGRLVGAAASSHLYTAN